ncbi:MAG TPA: M48 family metalloprotease [Candidatus Limnocylindria bacterium]|nr:M48 family metalloprotease [Candidatus Limnocylindria bacterium]
MRRFLFMALVALVLLVAPATAQARTRLDARVDALTPATLLTLDASSLVDPARQRRARAIADYRHLASAAWGISQILAFWWLWRSGTAGRICAAMRRRTRRRVLHRIVFGAVLGALGPVVGLPFAFAGYRIAFGAGVTDQTLGAWFTSYLVRIGLDALAGAVIVAVVLALVERVRTWYLVVAVLLFVFGVGGVMVQPLLPIGVPVKTTPRFLAAMGEEIANAVGVPGTPVVLLATSRRGSALTSSARGIGPTARVAIGDVVLEHLTVPELRVVLARNDEHVRFADPLRQVLLALVLLVLSAAMAVLLTDRVGFRRDDDALSRLALVAAFLGLTMAATYPIFNAYTRNIERRADLATIGVVQDRAVIVRTFVRYADLDMIPLCDRRSVRWYFDDRPALGARIAAVAGTADPCPGGRPAQGLIP